MAIQTRNSVLAIKEETTEAQAIVPAAGTDYVALQADFAMSPEFETLTNEELRASIGASKPVLGLENPSASFSHYVRHSGTVAQAPNYGKTMLKAAFGSEVIAAAERDVVSATVSTITVDTGEGAGFQKGDALLIKDPVNGFRIRAIDSVAGDVLTLGFNVPVAPAVGVLLGRSVTYVPVSTGHPTLSVWHFVGNGGALQAMSGARVVDMTLTAEAGQFVNASYSLEGNEYFFNPITITSTTNRLDFSDGTERNATIAAKTYKDPIELAEAIQTAMDGLTADTITVTYSSTTGRYTLASNGATFQLLWSTGTNAANTIGEKIGFSVAADDTAALSYTGDTPIDLEAPQTPVLDTADPLTAKNHEVMFGDSTDFACFNASSISINVATPKTDILSICAASGKSGSVINERTATAEMTALLSQYDAKQFERFRKGLKVKFQYSFGEKVGGNWVAGKSGMVYFPSATITSYSLEDQDGLVALTLGLTAYVEQAGSGEVFISFV